MGSEAVCYPLLALRRLHVVRSAKIFLGSRVAVSRQVLPVTGIVDMDNEVIIETVRRAGMISAVLLIIALFTAPAMTHADSGFYLGGSIGRSTLETDLSAPGEGLLNFDDGASAYKIFGGFNIDLFHVDLAIEGGYVDFGQPKSRIAGNDIGIDLTGWNLFGLAGLELGLVGVFAKAGFFDWSAETLVNGATFDRHSGTDPAYGIGMRFSMRSAEVRAEYEFFDVRNTDAGLLSVGVAWTF